MSDPKTPQASSEIDGKLNRRHFIAAVGAAAASSALFRETLKADTSTQYFYNSFGDVVEADPGMIALGIPVPPLPPGVYPPGQQPVGPDADGHARRGSGRLGVFHPDDAPPPGSGPGNTYVTPGYGQPNILMIMVDQLRVPRWVPNGSDPITAFDTILPNIANLRRHSTNFTNYCVAATNCTPSRATLLSGLYAQQSCMFKTQDGNTQPSLRPEFPNIATVLGQNYISNLNYGSYWIGKWHLSDFLPGANGLGGNGPTDYGFTNWPLSVTPPNLPGNSSQAAPNGLANEGTRGSNPSGVPPADGTLTSPPSTLPIYYNGNYVQEYDDAYIADQFINTFLPNVGTYNLPDATNPRWFAAVSFVNPHDLSFFPYSYGLSATDTTHFGYPSNAFIYHANNGMFTANSSFFIQGYQPPPTAGYSNSSDPGNFTIPAYNGYLYTSAPANWNVLDYPLGYNNGYGKPDAHTIYMNYVDSQDGKVKGYNVSTPSSSDTGGWLTFLNYYIWMQSCVDYHIGRVLQAFGSSPYWNSTIIVFLSDHGEYAGSHWLHGKGSTAYEESINVPLYISYPGQRGNYTTNFSNSSSSNSANTSYVCSSVDILPFLYTLALGNEDWRSNNSDMVRYLSGRESIFDVLHSTPANLSQRRLVTIGGSEYAYVLHTSDDVAPSTSPNHLVGMRTRAVGTGNVVGANAAGGKFVQYGVWPTIPNSTACPTYSSTSNNNNVIGYTQPTGSNTQYEFYLYPENPAELNNSYVTDAANSSSYNGGFTSGNVQSEIYKIPSKISSAYSLAFCDYWNYVSSENEAADDTSGDLSILL